MPPWRSIFAWFGLVPLLWAILIPTRTVNHPRPLRRAFLLAYVCGVLWYMGNCYWIRDTMIRYGDMPAGRSASAAHWVQPGAWAVFRTVRLGRDAGAPQQTGKADLRACRRAVLWVALDLAAARITSVPWDQLGYSQVDNALGESACAVDRRLWNHVRSCCVQRAACWARSCCQARSAPKLDRSARDGSCICFASAHSGSAVATSRSSRSPRPLSSSSPISMSAATTTGTRPASGIQHIAEFTKLGERAVQDLHRRNSADRCAQRRNHLPALSHAS